MFQRVILERTLPTDGRLALRGLAGADPILVELDTSARLKLSPRGGENGQQVIDSGHDRIVRAVERLVDAHSVSPETDSDDFTRLLVTALDLD